jgi:hypothetical protein
MRHFTRVSQAVSQVECCPGKQHEKIKSQLNQLVSKKGVEHELGSTQIL